MNDLGLETYLIGAVVVWLVLRVLPTLYTRWKNRKNN